MSIEEYFQNTVLRPIIKFQNDLLIAVFLQFCTKMFFLIYQQKRKYFILSLPSQRTVNLEILLETY